MNTLRPPAWHLWLLAAAVPAWAAPPVTSFLTPSKYSAALGESIALRFDAGAAKDAQPAPWPAEAVQWMFVRGGGEQENRHDVRPQRAGDDSVALRIAHSGVTVVGTLQSSVAEMTGSELRTYLQENVAADSIAGASGLSADRTVRVRHLRTGKTLIRVPSEDGQLVPSAVATNKSGLAAEIRPRFDPTAAEVGSDLPLMVYVDGDKCPGAKIRATNVATGHTTVVNADPSGSAHFRVTGAGLWRVEFHHARPLADDATADWVLYSGTLSFEVTKGAGQ